MACECGNNIDFKDCCGRFLNNSEDVQTCEELVRARFVAFGFGNFDYIENTQVDPLPDEVRNGEVPEWERLQIVSCEKGGSEDDTGLVEFIAYYDAQEPRVHHEISHFVRIDDKWRYRDGNITDKVAAPKGESEVAANVPCPCGSGRKFKRCCGVQA